MNSLMICKSLSHSQAYHVSVKALAAGVFFDVYEEPAASALPLTIAAQAGLKIVTDRLTMIGGLSK